MKFLNILTLSVATTCLISCQSEPIKTYYLTPYVTGTVLDKNTDKPIANVDVIYSSNFYTITNKKGHFELPAISVQSDKINAWEAEQEANGNFYVNKEGYISKSYWSSGLPKIKSRDSYELPEYINIGNVYLEKQPVDNHIESQIIEEMTFCQPHESQKEVNCIPKPVMDE